MRKILITNDDGIDADGIIRLARAAASYGEVWVVAPHIQNSAVSHGITLRKSIEVSEYDFPVEGVKAYSVKGTPADCIRIGILNIMPQKPDIVFSGINFGYNAGTDVQYSATVGAAMEAVFQGVPSVAFSEGTDDGYIITDKYLDEIVREAIDYKYKNRTILNINFPTCSPEDFKGILRNRTNSDSSVFRDAYRIEHEENGMKCYHVNGTFIDEAEEGSDLRALFDNYISIGEVINIH